MKFLLWVASVAAISFALPTNTNNVLAGEPLLLTSPAGQNRIEARSRPLVSANTRNRALLHHNLHRSNHSAPNVTWDHRLTQYAQVLAQRCYFQHNTTIGQAEYGQQYGQNIAAGVPESNITAVITDLWYNSEFPDYLPSYYGHEPNMTLFKEWGHFTQVVWKGSGTIGCYVQDCTSKGGVGGVTGYVLPYFTVCNYGPSGNWQGEFAANVGKPLGKAIARWDTGLRK